MTIFQMLIPVIQQFSIDCCYTVFINYAQKKQGQMIREERSSWHQVSGYTNDGGFVFNLAIIVTGLLGPLGLHMLSLRSWSWSFCLLLYGFLGVFVDSVKLWKKQK